MFSSRRRGVCRWLSGCRRLRSGRSHRVLRRWWWRRRRRWSGNGSSMRRSAHDGRQHAGYAHAAGKTHERLLGELVRGSQPPSRTRYILEQLRQWERRRTHERRTPDVPIGSGAKQAPPRLSQGGGESGLFLLHVLARARVSGVMIMRLKPR